MIELLQRGDIPAFVEQIGGGVATIYAGDPWTDEDASPQHVAAGPGWFEGPRWTQRRAFVEDPVLEPGNGDTFISLASDDDEAATAACIAPGGRHERWP